MFTKTLIKCSPRQGMARTPLVSARSSPSSTGSSRTTFIGSKSLGALSTQSTRITEESTSRAKSPDRQNVEHNDLGNCGDTYTGFVNSYEVPSIENLKGNFEALPLLKQRLGCMWEKKLFTDVVFKVGPEQFPIEAHRTILASGSEYFQHLLYNSKPITIEGKFVLYESEYSIPAFQAFIKSFYTNEIPISLNLPMALEVFYATKKYSVGFLQDQVLNHIRNAVSVANVFQALRVSTNMLELTSMVPICWNIIESQTSEVLDFHIENLDSYTFARILERDQLNLEEHELFQFLVKWGGHLCKQKGMKTTGKNKRTIIEPFLKHIRFTTMNLHDFNELVIPSRILEPREIQEILTHLTKNDMKALIPYKTYARHKSNLTSRRSEMDSTDYETTIQLSEIRSDSIVTTGRTGPTSSRYHQNKRSNASTFRSRRGAVQTPRF